MQDSLNINESDEEHEITMNPDDDDDEPTQDLSATSTIQTSVKKIKKDLENIERNLESSQLFKSTKHFNIISLDKLSYFLLKFVKKANLSLINRRILFASITPIHHLYLHVISNLKYKTSSQIINSTIISPPYLPNTLKNCFDYFIKGFKFIENNIQVINEDIFIQQFKKIFTSLKSFNSEIESEKIYDEIENNLRALKRDFQKLREKYSYKYIQKCKLDLKQFKIIAFPLFASENVPPSLKDDFVTYYKNFYSEFKSIKLFYNVNAIISHFKENWDQPLFWFLPCQTAKVDPSNVFNCAMEFLQIFWMTCDLNIINVDHNSKSEKSETNDHSNSTEEIEKNDNEKTETNETEKVELNEEMNEVEKSDAESNSEKSGKDSMNDPEDFRIKMFNILELMSFQNKLEPQNSSVIAQSFMRIVNEYNAFFDLNITLAPANFDIEYIKPIVSVVNVIPYDMKDVISYMADFLTQRVKLLKQYMYTYSNEINKELSSRYSQQILCNATFNEIFVYVNSFLTFASKVREIPDLYSMIKDEIHRLTEIYSDLLLKAQMTNDSKILANEVINKAKEFELSCCDNSFCENEDENEIQVDLFYSLKELAIATRKVLSTNFIKDEKRDFMERFYTFLKICCPYFQNLKQQIQTNNKGVEIDKMKQFLSDAFPLFDTHEIFRFETQNLEEPQFNNNDINKENEINDENDADDIIKDIDSKLVWNDENKELLFNKSFLSIREQARRLQIGPSEDWRSVFEFKSIYKTFCRLFIVSKPQLPINENPSEFESDIHKFFSFATKFIMDENFNVREGAIPLSTIIDPSRSLSIKWMFSNPKKKENEDEDKDEEKDKDKEDDVVSSTDKNHWNWSSLLFGIAFILVPHPIQTISVFLMIISNKKLNETESQQLAQFKDLFSVFLTNFNNETIENFCGNSNIHDFLSTFENELDFYFNLNEPAMRASGADNNNSFLIASIQKQNIKRIIEDMRETKEKYSKLSSIMTNMNVKYFDNPQSFSRFFVEIVFYANILKSFTDTLEVLKKYELLIAPENDPNLEVNYAASFNASWPFSPGFLDLDMYKDDLPGFLSSQHLSILRLSSLKPNKANIRRTFDFYMNMALSTYSYCFSSFNRFSFSDEKPENENSYEVEFDINSVDSNSTPQFSWNRSNYSSKSSSRMKIKKSKGNSPYKIHFSSLLTNNEEVSEKAKTQEQCFNEISKNFQSLAILYSGQNSKHPSIDICCEIISISTGLIKLLESTGISDFSILSTILSGLIEVCFAIIMALNIKKEVEQLINSTVYFASLFGIELSKTLKAPQTQPPDMTKEMNQEQEAPEAKKHPKKRRRKSSVEKQCNETKSILNNPEFKSLSSSIQRASSIFDETSSIIRQNDLDKSRFCRLNALFDSLKRKLNEICIPTSSEEFGEIISQTKSQCENINSHSENQIRRLKVETKECLQKTKRTQSMIESDCNSIIQKIENETIKSEQLDEDISNVKSELKHCKSHVSTPAIQPRKERKSAAEISETNSGSCDVLNFNFNNKSSSLKKNPNGKVQIILSQAKSIQKQNQMIQNQLRKNQIELEVLKGINDQEKSDTDYKSAKKFIEKDKSIDDVFQNILKNSPDLFNSASKEYCQFDQEEDEKVSNFLSKEAVFRIVSEINKIFKEQQKISTIEHNELCDRIEMLGFSLINETKANEEEMIRLQNQLKNMKNSQKEKFVKLKNILREIDLDEE